MLAESLPFPPLFAGQSRGASVLSGVCVKHRSGAMPLGKAPAPVGRFSAEPKSLAANEGQLILPIYLAAPATVRLGLFDLRGRKVLGVIRRGLGAGQHRIALNLDGSGLTDRRYSYQLHVDKACLGDMMTDVDRPLLIKSGTIYFA